MEVRLSISDFARMTYLGVKTLHHYHQIGLLVPAEVDPRTGYRRYGREQVVTGQVIRRLRDLGLPLDEVAKVVRILDVAVRNAAITAHLRRMEEELERTRDAVASLRRLVEDSPTAAPIELRGVPALPALAIRAQLTEAEGPGWAGAALAELREVLAASGVDRAGPDSALYAVSLLENGGGEVVAFIPTTGPGQVSGRAEVFEVPAAELAVIEHLGSVEDLDQAFAALGEFVAQQAIGVDGPMREHYLVSDLDTDDESRHRTEVGWPVFHATTSPPK